MLKELPKYDYVSEGYAIVTWHGERVFELFQGKVDWILKVEDKEMVFRSLNELEEYAATIPLSAAIAVSYRSLWWVVGDDSLHCFGNEDRAKNFIERILRVREIIRGHLKGRTSSPL